MKIESSAFGATGKDDDRHSIGTVLIEFSDQQVATFDDIREDMFENWVESDYDPELVPVDMREAWQPWAELLGDPDPEVARKIRTSSDENDEEDLEDEEDRNDEDEQEDEEEDEDAPKFHPLDFIGQATGFPTQGFDPPVIADDDLMGQITGFPTPGWGVQPTPKNDAPTAPTKLVLPGPKYEPASAAKLAALNAVFNKGKNQ
jgi:hypothetical protein